MRYLLDTNACIRLLNNSSPPLVARMQQTAPSDVALCSVVKAELIFGAYRSTRAAENLRLLERFFAPFTSLAFDDHCVEQFGRMHASLQEQGTPIGPYDLMIAATTVAADLILVTANVREFERVVGLRFENWENED